MADPADPAMTSAADPADPAMKSVADPADPAMKSAADPADPAMKSVADPADPAVRSAADPADPAKKSSRAMQPTMETSAGPVTLVVPCYNEARRLRPDAFVEALDAMPRLRLRFVNDGSKDTTLEVLEALRARRPDRVIVQSLERNGGKAEAVRRGVLAACAAGDVVVGYWDADLATPFDELAPFLAVIDAQPQVEVVLGSRVKLLGRKVERRFHRHVYGRAFATAVSLMLGLPVYDTQCGAKLLRATPAVREAFERPFQSRWIFDVELLMRLVGRWQREGLDPTTKIVEVPLRTWTDVPGSKVTPRDGLRAAAELARLGRTYGVPVAAR